MFGIKIMKEATYNNINRNLEHLKSENHELLDQIEKIKQAENGGTVCGQYCECCEHGLEVYTSLFAGKTFQCALVVPCKKFERI